MKNIKILLFLLILWMMFTIGCITAPLFALIYPFIKHKRYSKNYILAADRMCAAMLGFSGRVTLSTECIDKMRWLYKILNIIEQNHCEDSAITEHAYCRLSDKKIGHK